MGLSLALAAPVAARVDRTPVMGFEPSDSAPVLSHWIGNPSGPAGTVFLDSSTVHSGRYAGRIERDRQSPSSFSAFAYTFPPTSRGGRSSCAAGCATRMWTVSPGCGSGRTASAAPRGSSTTWRSDSSTGAPTGPSTACRCRSIAGRDGSRWAPCWGARVACGRMTSGSTWTASPWPTCSSNRTCRACSRPTPRSRLPRACPWTRSRLSSSTTWWCSARCGAFSSTTIRPSWRENASGTSTSSASRPRSSPPRAREPLNPLSSAGSIRWAPSRRARPASSCPRAARSRRGLPGSPTARGSGPS